MGAEAASRGTPLATASASSGSSAQASEHVVYPMQPPPPPPSGRRRRRTDEEATGTIPASTPRAPLTALEDWTAPASTISSGTATTSSEVVVYAADLPPSAAGTPPEAELPFEPVQPSQQRLAMQASPQTSGFTCGQSTLHGVPAPPPARAVAAGGHHTYGRAGS